MQNILAWFLSPLSMVFFQKALIGGCMVAIVAAVVGCLMVLRRMAFLGDALAHAMIAGVAGGYLVMKLMFGLEAHAPGMLLGAMIAALCTVGLIGFVAQVSRIKQDTTIGIMYAGIFALGIVLVSIFQRHIHLNLMHFIMGDVLGISDTDLWITAIVAAVVLTILILFFRQFQLVAFDPVMAASIGLPVVLLDYVLTVCVALVVVSAVNMVGVILVVGLLITPAATAYLLSERLARMMWLAALFGVTSVVGGLYLCVWLNTAGAGAILLFATLQFLLVLTVAPRHGLLVQHLRRHWIVPQHIIEDVLAEFPNEGMQTMVFYQWRNKIRRCVNMRRVLRGVVRLGLVVREKKELRLTEQGTREAQRIRRIRQLRNGGQDDTP